MKPEKCSVTNGTSISHALPRLKDLHERVGRKILTARGQRGLKERSVFLI